VRNIALLSLVVLSSGCGIAPYRPGDLSSDAVVLEVPPLQQDDWYDCGLAAISALCAYHHVRIPDGQRTELAELASSEQGLSGDELRTALERNGMEVYLYEGQLQGGPTGLKENIHARRPVLVMLELWGRKHYGLVVGIEPDARTLVVLDPALGLVVMEAADFERRWQPTRRFALLAVPAG
jgi:ABC-type bacteriocin/lantibiotic exporter with double-glycine peptidase domain